MCYSVFEGLLPNWLPLSLLPEAIQFLPLYRPFSAEQPLSIEGRTPKNDVASQSIDQCVSQQSTPRGEAARRLERHRGQRQHRKLEDMLGVRCRAQ